MGDDFKGPDEPWYMRLLLYAVYYGYVAYAFTADRVDDVRYWIGQSEKQFHLWYHGLNPMYRGVVKLYAFLFAVMLFSLILCLTQM